MMTFTVIDKETGKAVIASDVSDDIDEWSVGWYSPSRYTFAITQNGELVAIDDWGKAVTCRSDKLGFLVRKV